MSVVGSDENRVRRGGVRALGSTVLPAWSVRALAGSLLIGAVGMPWLAGWQGVVERTRGKAVVEEGKVEVLRPELVRVPGGTFVMGAPEGEEESREDERPQHLAEVGDLEVCRTEVTQGQWKAVMGDTVFDCGYGCGEEYPAHSVSWNDAVEFMNRLTEKENELLGEGEKLTACYEEQEGSWAWMNKECTGYRLPTETEWEYVARAGSGEAYSFGGDATKLDEYAWYGQGSDGTTHPVGKKKPNTWGLYDVHGNVWEWVWDGYAEKYPSERTMKGYIGPETEFREKRGGSFKDEPASLRSARRRENHHTLTYMNVGVRCVRVWLPPEPSTP